MKNKLNGVVEETSLVDFHSILNDKTLLTIDKEMSTYFKVRIVRLHRKLTNRLTQYDLIDGTKNVWIVKPSYNARGIGIYCTNKLSQITSSVG